MKKEIADILEEEALIINNPDFIAEDPVQFPRRFSSLQDIEIVSLLAATIAWGKRSMICADAEKMLNLMGHDPYKYIMERGYEELDPRLNIHRTFFAEHFAHMLRGLRKIYSDYGSLDAFSAHINAAGDYAPAWKLVEEINKITLDENNGVRCSRGLPQNLKTTALKRVNMALRWLVRDDGIVDMGVWKSIPKSKLYIPLDVHVGNTARALEIIDRKADDRKTVELLTSELRTLRPDDPVYYDYALFGIGVHHKELFK